MDSSLRSEGEMIDLLWNNQLKTEWQCKEISVGQSCRVVVKPRYNAEDFLFFFN